MSRRKFDIYYDVNARIYRNSTGNPLRRENFPYIYFRERPIVNLHLVTDSSATAYTSLTASQTFQGAVDNAFTSAALMCKTLNAGINVAGDWGATGTADPTAGELSIKLNADTTGFQTKISTYAELPGTELEIIAKAADNSIDEVFRMPIKTLGLMNDSGAIPSVISDNWEWFTDAATGKQCAWVMNDDGEVMETLTPAGVEGVE